MTEAAHLPAVAGSNLTPVRDVNDSVPDPLKTATGVYVTVHGHFYQPPRENPYLDAIERQPSAAPFHNWNERIHHECYRPNAFARILNDRGEVVGIANNYEYLSFNIGATLMSWLERYDVEVYQRILEADRKSGDRLNGHGNAIAQVYNHIIMPLANERDKYTQIRWGIEDFRSRFGRMPEGMWLAETAVDYATLEALVQEGIRFIILAPSQAQRCRAIPTEDVPISQWHEVGGSQIDPTRPYRCFLKDRHSSNAEQTTNDFGQRTNDKYIDIFFYDGPISRDMGFSDALNNSHHLVGRIGQAVRGDHRTSQLISVATDGETFGHHKGSTEKTLAYSFTEEFPRQDWTVTNFAHYLSINPPTWEVKLKPVTAWSCSHGVDRWQDDCGCGGGGGWHQKWRRPLRESLDWLRDRLIDVYESAGRQLLSDPWLARDEYIKVMRDRSPENVSHFLSRHQSHELTADELVDTLRLLEMQRHALLMYTSCGWFFEEISRPEGTQILRYAARAMELAGDVAGVQLDKEFLSRLILAPSNVDLFKHGGEVYRQLVATASVSFQQVAAQYAITSLFKRDSKKAEGSEGSEGENIHSPLLRHHSPLATPTSPLATPTSPLAPNSSHRLYCYTVNQLDYQLQRMGTLTLAVGQVKLVSEITWESEHLVFAVLHLGGWDFHCCIQPFAGRLAYSQIKEKVFEALQQASAARAIQAMMEMFGDRCFNLQHLLPEERHRIMQLLSQETLTRLDQLYTQVYRDNYSVLMAFKRDCLPVPQELQVAAEIALSHRCLHLVRSLCEEIGESQLFWQHLTELEIVATEAKHLHCQFSVPEGKQTLEQLIWRSLWQVLHNTKSDTVEADMQRLERLIDVGYQLNLGLSLERMQEIYFGYLHDQILPQLMYEQQLDLVVDRNGDRIQLMCDIHQMRHLLKLGQKLAVDVNFWLKQLS